jgi:hypothetical protein
MSPSGETAMQFAIAYPARSDAWEDLEEEKDLKVKSLSLENCFVPISFFCDRENLWFRNNQDHHLDQRRECCQTRSSALGAVDDIIFALFVAAIVALVSPPGPQD